MADTKISALPAATTLAGTEPLAGVQSGATVKITAAQIATEVLGIGLHAQSAATALAGTEEIAGYQSSAGAKITVNQIMDFLDKIAAGGGHGRLLWKKTGADMNSTADQAMTKVGNWTTALYETNRINNASISLTTAAGGIYSAASKGGDQILVSTTVYTGLTGATLGLRNAIVSPGVAAGVRSDTALYVALTTPQGSAATADFYIYGWPLT